MNSFQPFIFKRRGKIQFCHNKGGGDSVQNCGRYFMYVVVERKIIYSYTLLLVYYKVPVNVKFHVVFDFKLS